MSTKPDIYQYLDYRQFLQDTYRFGQTTGLSHRELGKRGNFDAGLVSKIFTGQRNLSPGMAQRFARAFGLENHEETFFILLVRYCQSRLPSSRQKLLAELITCGKGRIALVTQNQHAYYRHWYYTAIRELLNVISWDGQASSLAQYLIPPIGAVQARHAIQILQELQLVQADVNGHLRPARPLITSGHESQATEVNAFIQQSIELALEAMDRFPPQERNLSAVSFSASEATAGAIAERLRTFRREIMELVAADPHPERVYQLNLQLFPLSRRKTP